jgi:hypothetical protein
MGKCSCFDIDISIGMVDEYEYANLLPEGKYLAGVKA